MINLTARPCAHSPNPRYRHIVAPRPSHRLTQGKAQGLDTGRAQADSPSLPIHRCGPCEGAAHQDREIGSSIRIAHRLIADHVGVCRSGGVGERLAGTVVGDIRPEAAVLRERFAHQIEQPRARHRSREGRVLCRIGGPWRGGRLGEEQEPVERHLGDSGRRVFRRVVDAERAPCAPKAGSCRIDRAVPERRRQQEIEMAAVRRDRGFCLLDQFFEQGLFGERVGQLQGRDAMLGLDEPPARAVEAPEFRRERDARPDRR